jgi:hypothetical protein
MRRDFRNTTGPVPIHQLLPRLRLRIRTIPVRIWHNGAWHVAWIVLSYHELAHEALTGGDASCNQTRSQA